MSLPFAPPSCSCSVLTWSSSGFFASLSATSLRASRRCKKMPAYSRYSSILCLRETHGTAGGAQAIQRDLRNWT
eukprot:5932173-Pyramimonas_sp.AAC.1